MRVACLMSGSGTNVVKIIENQRSRPEKTYQVVLIFTDVEDESKSNAEKIAKQYDIPLVTHDILQFYAGRGHPSKRDLTLRPEFDRESMRMIELHDVDLLALGGYMSIITKPMLDRYQGKIVNVHPGDLSIKEDEKRKFAGLHAVRDAILAGETQLYSTTHIVREKVDYGEILMRSEAVPISFPQDTTLGDLSKAESKKLLERMVSDHQELLKERGDWMIFPKTLELIAEGRFALDGLGNVYLDGKFLPNGLRL